MSYCCCCFCCCFCCFGQSLHLWAGRLDNTFKHLAVVVIVLVVAVVFASVHNLYIELHMFLAKLFAWPRHVLHRANSKLPQ